MEPKRTNHRLPTWDYTQSGMYYVTICVAERKHALGHIIYDDNKLDCPASFIPSKIGTVCIEAGESLSERFDDVRLEKLTLMPDHIHMLASIDANGSTALGDFVFAFKRFVTRKARAVGFNDRLWQKNYYDHVVRDNEDVLRIMEYMENNPIRWAHQRRENNI